MSRIDGKQQAELPAEIARQVRTSRNVRYLRTLPVFQVPSEVPVAIRDLLSQLERIEHRGACWTKS